VNHITLGAQSDDAVVTLMYGEGWCDIIEQEHRWREYEKARIPA